MRCALIVGIDKYKRSELDLNGCVNDAHDVFKALTRSKNYTEIVMLLNESATKPAIVKNLTKMVRKLKRKDSLVYYHSGHGTQVIDKNSDESDGLDEALVTHDFDIDDPFTDDVLKECLSKQPKKTFISLIFDTCHSGGFEMDIGEQKTTRSVILKESLTNKNANIRKLGVKANNPKTQRHLLLSGCKEQQYSYEEENEGNIRGLMTFTLCKMFHANTKHRWSSAYPILKDTITKQTNSAQVPQFIAPKRFMKRRVFA